MPRGAAAHRVNPFLLTLMLGMGLAACGDGSGTQGQERLVFDPDAIVRPKINDAGGAAANATADSLALAAEDLPDGMARCSYSGPMANYLEAIKSLSEDAFNQASTTWQKVQASGGSEANVTVYADSARTCDAWVAGKPEEPFALASAIVVKFPSDDAAVTAFGADHFGQSRLLQQQGTLTGESTGLGPNSITGGSETAGADIYLAVWQQGPFNVFVRGVNISREEFTTAVNAEVNRIQAAS